MKRGHKGSHQSPFNRRCFAWQNKFALEPEVSLWIFLTPLSLPIHFADNVNAFYGSFKSTFDMNDESIYEKLQIEMIILQMSLK